jgi:hypothetical protein
MLYQNLSHNIGCCTQYIVKLKLNCIPTFHAREASSSIHWRKIPHEVTAQHENSNQDACAPIYPSSIVMLQIEKNENLKDLEDHQM